MGRIDGTRSWFQRSLVLLSVALITRAVDGHRLSSRIPKTEGRSNSSADGENTSDTTHDGEFVDSSASADIATSSGGQSPGWMQERESDTDQPSGHVSAADLEVASQSESAPLPMPLRHPALISRHYSSRHPRENQFPQSFSLVSHGEVNGSVGVVTSDVNSSSPRRTRPHSWWRVLRARVRGLRWRGDTSQNRVPTPFGVNRYVLLFAYGVSLLLSAAGLVAWPAMRTLLLAQGAYAYLCQNLTNETSTASVTSQAFNGTSTVGVSSHATNYLCVDQELSIEVLFSLGIGISCVVCVLGGFLYERIGPQTSAVLGQVLNMVGWGLLGFSSARVAAPAAIVTIGGVTPLVTFPTLNLRHLFPHHEQLIVMALGAAMSASVILPSLVLQLARWIGVQSAVGVYIGAGLLPCFLVAALLMPRKDFSEPRSSALRDSKRGGSRDRLGLEHRSEAYRESEPRNQRRVQCQQLARRILQAFSRNTPLVVAFISLLLYRAVVVLTTGYYLQSSPRMLNLDANNALEYMMFLSPLPCLVFGFATLRYPLIRLMMAVSLVALLSYVGPLFQTPVCHYLSTFCFSIFVGAGLPQTTAMLGNLASARQYPAFLGLLVVISGVLGSLSAPLYAIVTVGLFEGDPRPVQIVCIVALALQFLWLLLLRAGARLYEDNSGGQVATAAASQAASSQDENADDGDD